jgi:VanZ family protein
MAVIFSASTGLGAPSHTSRFFRPLLHWLFPRLTEEQFQQIHYAVRKTAHFTEYAILGILVWRLVHFDAVFAAFSLRRQGWFALLLCLLYASSDEFHQKFVPMREPAIHDVLIDTSGAGLGILASLGFRRWRSTLALKKLP